MNLEYAYIGKPPQFNYAKSNTDISQYHQALIEAYDKYENEVHVKYKKGVSEYGQRKEAFDKKKCIVCGGKLKLVQDMFWGCVNYGDGIKHTTFSIEPNLQYYNVGIHKDWVTEIIRSCGLKDKVKAKQAFEFYLSIGFEDLFKKFDGRETGQYINGLIGANKRSKEQEWYCALYLESIYTTVLAQKTVIYKEVGEKQKFCIPDFICSSEFEVIIVDAKLDWCNERQLDLYVELIKFMMHKAKDERPVNGAFMMYDTAITQRNCKYPIWELKPWELEGWQNNPHIPKKSTQANP